LIVKWHCPGRFEETPYLVTHPRPERRRLPSSPRFQSIEAPEPFKEHAQPVPCPPEEEEIAVARRVPAATLRVWESLLAPRGYTKVGSELIKAAPAETLDPTPDPPPSLPRASKGKGKARAVDPPDLPTSYKGSSALAKFTRSKSFAPCTEPPSDDSNTPALRQPFRKVQSLFLPQPDPPTQVAPEPDGSPPKIFIGKRFRVCAEARSASVRTAIESRGGMWVEDEDEEERVDFVIVRLVRYSSSLLLHTYKFTHARLSGSKLFVDEADSALRPSYRTECWLEGCLSHERICTVEEHPAFSPLSHTTHFSGVTLSPSGLNLAEDMWVKRLARALGNDFPSLVFSYNVLTTR
jgi:DNA replication regulator DPB11